MSHKYQQGDVVRIVRESAKAMGTPIRSYIGQEAVIMTTPGAEGRFYDVAIDVPVRSATLGGALQAPRFLVTADMIEPDVTKAMLRAAVETGAECTCEECLTILYRAMRKARFDR